MFMRMSMLCAFLIAALAASPASAEKRSWSFITSGADMFLVYGVPESEAVTLSFICAPKKNRIDIVTTVLPSGVRVGQSGIVKLLNGASSLEFKGTVGRDNEGAGEHFSALTTIDTRLFDLLEKGASLRIEAMGAHDSVPLTRIKRPLAQIRKACR